MKHPRLLIVVGATLIGAAACSSSTSTHPKAAPVTALTATATATSGAVAPPSSAASSPATSPTSVTTPSATPAAALPNGPVPAGIKISDLSWTSPTDGWLLGATKSCAAKPCTAILHTTDGGMTWRGGPAPRVTVANAGGDCSKTGCVSEIWFANQQVGYVFAGEGGEGAGNEPFAVTTDGGNTWSVTQEAPVAALEPAGGTVFRVTSTTGCPPGCSYTLQRAAVGSSTFTDVTTPAIGEGDGVQLILAGRDGYLVAFGNVAGGAQSAQPFYLVSHDSGATWLAGKDPCITLSKPTPSQGSDEIDTTSLAAAPGGTLSVDCRPRISAGADTLLVSHDAGNTFATATTFGSAKSPPDYQDLVQLSATAVLDVVDGPGEIGSVTLSVDGGHSFTKVLTIPRSPTGNNGDVSVAYAGSQDATHARVVSFGIATVFSTADGGRTWTSHAFS